MVGPGKAGPRNPCESRSSSSAASAPAGRIGMSMIGSIMPIMIFSATNGLCRRGRLRRLSRGADAGSVQCHGHNSCSGLCGTSAMRAKTSASQALGSMLLRRAVMMSVAIPAARSTHRAGTRNDEGLRSRLHRVGWWWIEHGQDRGDDNRPRSTSGQMLDEGQGP